MDRWPVTIGFVRDPDGYLVELVQRHPWGDGDDTTHAWFGQYCLYVSDLQQTIKFYETLGLTCTSQTDIPNHKEAILENGAGKGGKIQLAKKLDDPSPIDMGGAMWKLYVHTDDCEGLHKAAVGRGLPRDDGADAARTMADDDLVPPGSGRLPDRVDATSSRLSDVGVDEGLPQQIALDGDAAQHGLDALVEGRSLLPGGQ